MQGDARARAAKIGPANGPTTTNAVTTICTARCQAIWTGLLTATTRSSRVHETVMSERRRRRQAPPRHVITDWVWGLATW